MTTFDDTDSMRWYGMTPGNKRIVGLFYVERGQSDLRSLLECAVRQARTVIDGAWVVQFTDMVTDAMEFVDEVIRRPSGSMGMMESRIEHFANFAERCLLIDPDVYVQEDVWDVFDSGFDVALTRRERLIVDGENYAELMPYNTGVMFSNGPEFWCAVLDEMRPMADAEREWYGDQIAVARVAASGKFRVLDLPCEQYNYTPGTQGEDVIFRKVVHYKGVRKQWMLNRLENMAL